MDDFVKFSKDYVLFCHITTAIEGEKHGDLLQEKGGQRFPYIVFMDADGNVITEHLEERTPEGFAKMGKIVTDYVTLKTKAESGNKPSVIDFTILQLALGKITTSDAQKKLKDAGTPTKEQQVKLDEELLNASV